MTTNIKNRKAQINKIRSQFESNPYFKIVEKLYYNGVINRITTITKLLKKIKFKKDGSIDRRTIRQIKKYTILEPVTEDVLISESIIKIDQNKIDEGYNIVTHKIEFKKNKKKGKNLYIQTVKYYDNNDNLIDDYLDYKDDFGDEKFDFRNKEFISKTPLQKNFLDSVNFQMTTNIFDSYIWTPKLITEIYPNYYTIITTKTIKPKTIIVVNIPQEYKDDKDGICVYNNMLKYFEGKLDNKKAVTIYNKLTSEKGKQYKKAYKLDELKSLCNFCDSSLYIRDLVKGKEYDIIIKNEYARFKVEMVNTRFNHLDLLLSDTEIKFVTNDEYEEIKNKYEFYVEKYGKLQTLDGVFSIIKTDFQLLSEQWKQEFNIQNKYIYDDSKESNLIDEYDYKLHSFFNEMSIENKLYNEIDLKKAYFNFSNKKYNKHYVGMPTGSFITINVNDKFSISDYNTLLHNGLIGFFQVKIKNINDKKEQLNKLNFKKNKLYTLTTPQINLLKDYIEFEFINICYSPKCDINFNTVLENGYSFLDKDDEVKGYCKMFGLLLCESSPIQIKIKPLKIDEGYYTIINDKNYEVYNNNGILNISYTDDKYKSYKHMAYFIHSYTRTLIIEQVLKMDSDKIFGVKLDSIVYKKDYTFDYDKNIFGIKKANIESLFNLDIDINNINNALDNGIDEEEFEKENKLLDSGYFCNYINTSTRIKCDKSFLNNDGKYYIMNSRVCFIGGKGGSGKTYSLLKKGLNRSETVYTTNCWNLIQGMKEKYIGILGYSLPNLTGVCDGNKCEKIQNPNIKNIVIDEATLINKSTIDNIIKLYPNAFIFIVGDIEKNGSFYQCSLPMINVYNPSETKYQYIKYTKSYRFDNNLNDKLDKLRIYMKKIFLSPFKMKGLSNYIKESFQGCYKNKNDVIYNKNDVGISAKDDYKLDNKLTNFFINKGTTPRYFIKTTNRKTNQLRGQELNTIPSHKNYEMKLFKTIHSFQGLDLDENNKIIINIDKNFDFNLFYTALSRARREDQIIILK
tara:strand:- start:86 stop:3142 length:3057 start_codon:yes stop_codon:yes gene_type:complete